MRAALALAVTLASAPALAAPGAPDGSGPAAAVAAAAPDPDAVAPDPDAAAPDPDAPPPIVPDPRAVEEAREANFVPTSVREGFAIGIAVGPAIQIGYGIGGVSGSGGGFDLRLGTVASPRWVWLLELASTTYQAKGSTRLSQSAVLTFGGQLYVNDAFWLRLGAGFATFTRRDDEMPQEQFGGVGGIGAGGIDLFRRRSFALSLEAMASVALYAGEGAVVGTSFQLGLSWY